jgi:MoaA/NifB/PqqE/SkfB family radical SAM enzyme
MANQMSGIKFLSSRGIVCKVNCVVLKGINDHHVFEVTKKARELGAYITNIMPHIPLEGSAFEGLERMNNIEINELRNKCEVNIKQMRHCRQCRSDAVGTLDNDISIEYRGFSVGCSGTTAEIPKMKFAVATKSGMLVDQHFGQADDFYIYESDGKTASFIEKRSVSRYCTGSDECGDRHDKIQAMLSAVEDCKGVLALRIGEAPSEKLKEMGIAVISTYDRIEDAVKTAALKS